MKVSKGTVTIDLDFYEHLVEMEKQFKKHSIIGFNDYGHICTFYSRDAFDKRQLEKINKLTRDSEKLTLAFKEACAKIQQLEQQKVKQTEPEPEPPKISFWKNILNKI